MKTPSKRTVANTLRKSAKLIETHGWLKGRLGNSDIGFCAVGALRCASDFNSDGNRIYVPARELMDVAAKMATGSNNKSYDLIDFNDLHAKSEKQVIRLFRKAASDLDHGAPLPVTTVHLFR